MPAIHVFDWVLLAVYLIASVTFGLWVSRRQRAMSDFLVGGRDLPWVAVLLSIVATETSTITFLSVPGLAYGGNLTFLQLGLGYILGRIAVVRVLLPLYFRGEIFTSYQVLGRRFGGATKKVASALFLITRTLADGLRLFLTALVLQAMAGFDLGWSVLVLGTVTIFYTFVGGMKAVVWMDCIQFFVYLAGGLIAYVVIVQEVPGFWGALQDLSGNDKLRVFDFHPDHRSWSFSGAAVIGGAFLSFATHGSDQLMVQRYLCARSQRQASLALISSGVVIVFQFAFFLLLGTSLYLFYQQFPPAEPFAQNDEVLPYFVVHSLSEHVGAVGLVVGACFAAAMSTLSSSLNSSATSAVHDLWAALRRLPMTDEEALQRVKLLTIGFGLLQMAVAFFGQFLAASVVQNVLAITGFTTGVILGVFLLAILCTRATGKDAVFGLCVGLAGVTAAKLATDLAWPWFPVLGSLLTLAAGWMAAARNSPAAAGEVD